MVTTDFVIGEDDFADLIINPTAQDAFYYFFNQRLNRLVKRFVLDCTHPKVTYFCAVALIKKGEKFTPRLHFTIRSESGRLARIRAQVNEETIHLKASISLKDCHDQFWQLVSYLKSLAEIEDIPEQSFSLVSRADADIVVALRERDPASVKNIIRQLSEGIALSEQEVSELLQRKKRLREFEHAMEQCAPENHWQDFFETNKWIFGYGLNYVILRVTEQPHVGGTQVSGKGG